MEAKRGSITVVALTGANQEIAPPNMKRVSIYFGKSVNSANFGVNTRPLVNVDDGIQGNFLTGHSFFSIYNYGEMIRGPWFAFASAGTGNVTVMEGLEE